MDLQRGGQSGSLKVERPRCASGWRFGGYDDARLENLIENDDWLEISDFVFC